MVSKNGIKKLVKVNTVSEVMLDGEDGLSASLSSNESGYPMYNINVERGFYTVFELKRKYERQDKRIILDSDFQRESVWKPVQKAELVESILMGLPLPIFYFNQDKHGRLIVVDGRQRLTALFEFMSDKWALKNLKVLAELNGKKFGQLSPVVQGQIEDYQIQAHVIQPPTPDRIKFDIFDRVNRAGTQLNKQEIRNALYQGNATELLNRIVKTEEFRIATEDAFIKNARMKDRYLVIRFLAFELYFQERLMAEGKPYLYKNDMDELLGLSMEYINTLAEKEVGHLYDFVLGALKNAIQFLDKNAFRMVRANGARSPINMNVFEILMHLMSRLTGQDLAYRDRIGYRIEELKGNSEFQESIGSHRDNWQKAELRFKMVDAILEDVLSWRE
ncbi:MAG: DUF262 domain-containing protein [Lachnospiraceae bacterium]|nr:DUF262 domain-containing protein [Lachnospiraceae bacterium]